MKNVFKIMIASGVLLCVTWAIMNYSNFGGISGFNKKDHHSLKLYWFIPDGLRGDPDQFKIFQWAEEGLLPNIKKMMDQGAYGYSIPVFPGHTPTNFATLLTGTEPAHHGVADGPMHIEGYPLSVVSKNGFSSQAKRLQPIWKTLEDRGFEMALLSVPGSTPPEISRGMVLRGRWGGWGVNFPAVIFQGDPEGNFKKQMGIDRRLFNIGHELTKFVKLQPSMGWSSNMPKSYSASKEVKLTNAGHTLYGLLLDSTDDHRSDLDLVVFSYDKKNILAQMKPGERSSWLPVELIWQVQNDYTVTNPKKMEWERNLNTLKISSNLKISVIKIGEAGQFRVRVFYDNLNPLVLRPSHMYDELASELGPMTDFVDNFPPQLVYFPEDKNVFLAEANDSLEWHRAGARYFAKSKRYDGIIHSIYTPNQMLTSRWWMPAMDENSLSLAEISDQQKQSFRREVLSMYQSIDRILGEALEQKDSHSVIVLSSDHGAIPLNWEVAVNDLFARKGWLKYKSDRPEQGIDWEDSKVVFLKMTSIYINPNGFSGVWRRASGEEYENLRSQVAKTLMALKGSHGKRPVLAVKKWEESNDFGLPTDRVGDLIVNYQPGFVFIENLYGKKDIFIRPNKSGYKQGINPQVNKGMWTPFLIVGPGIKKGYSLKQPVSHLDQYPTVMKAIGVPSPKFVSKKPLEEIFN